MTGLEQQLSVSSKYIRVLFAKINVILQGNTGMSSLRLLITKDESSLPITLLTFISN